MESCIDGRMKMLKDRGIDGRIEGGLMGGWRMEGLRDRRE